MNRHCLAAMAVLAMGASGSAWAGMGAPAEVEVLHATRMGVSRPLAELIQERQPTPIEPTGEVPNIILGRERDPAELAQGVTGGVQRTPSVNNMPAALQSFAGNNNTSGVIPPDTVGDVSPTHYFQWVNLRFSIYNKSTGAVVTGPNNGNTLWSGFGGACQTTNSGDPIVLWDDAAQRWVLSQFTGSGTPRQCFAVSQTSDPLGAYYLYEFVFPRFNDYPHIGIWLDGSGQRNGYYFVVHEFTGQTFNGASFVVVDRDRMLSGTPAAQVAMVRFPNIDAYGALPPHLEGTRRAPAGACAPFVHFDNNSSEYLFWDLCPDWSTPANSTVTPAASPQRVPAGAPFSTAVAQVAQAGTAATLDNFSSNVMYRATARAFPAGAPTETSLVINHAVNVGGGIPGIKWVHFDLRSTGAGGVLYADGFEDGPAPSGGSLVKRIVEEGTYAPDGNSRWMGGIAIDQNGYIGVGYSVAGSALNPQIRYSGRNFDDDPNTLRNEASCTAGIANGSQTSTSQRWGDYASMSVDPSDECTFWFTSEFYPTTASSSWNTRICSFRFPECGQADYKLVGNGPTRFEICAAGGSDPTLAYRGAVVNGFSGSINLSLSGLPGGVSGNFSSNPLPAGVGGTVTLAGAVGLPSGEYNGLLTGTNGARTRSLPLSLGVSAASPAVPSPSTPANGAVGVDVRPVLNWAAVPGALRYRLRVATDSGFANVIADQTVTTNSATVAVALNANTQYFWRVDATNYCGTSAASSTFSFTTGTPGTCPAGTTQNSVFFDDNETDAIVWTTSAGAGANTWARAAAQVGTGMSTRLWLGDNSAVTSDQYLVSPSINVPAGAQNPQLSFDTFHAFEEDGATACWDGGLLEVSTNGGSSWTQVPDSELMTDPYSGRITDNAANPASGRQGWCRNIGGTSRLSVVRLNTWAGQSIRLRFRIGTDSNTAATEPNGWQVDNIRVFGCAP